MKNRFYAGIELNGMFYFYLSLGINSCKYERLMFISKSKMTGVSTFFKSSNVDNESDEKVCSFILNEIANNSKNYVEVIIDAEEAYWKYLILNSNKKELEGALMISEIRPNESYSLLNSKYFELRLKTELSTRLSKDSSAVNEGLISIILEDVINAEIAICEDLIIENHPSEQIFLEKHKNRNKFGFSFEERKWNILVYQANRQFKKWLLDNRNNIRVKNWRNLEKLKINIEIENSTKTLDSNLKKFIWNGQQKQLIELLIELQKKGWFEEIEQGDKKSAISSLLSAIDFRKDFKSKDYPNSIYQKFKGELDENTGKYEHDFGIRYKPNFSEIKPYNGK